MPDLIPFAYHNHAVRTMQHDDGSTWWVAADVCAALALPNVSRACARLKDQEKDELTLSDVTGRPQVMLIVSEPGLYRLIMRSRKKEAEDFQQWVYAEVLPQIRKTGSYNQPSAIDRFPELRAIVELAQSTAEARLLAEEAKATATQAQIAAAHASANAERALDTQQYLTVAEYVYVEKLQRQLPESAYKACSDHLRLYCMDHRIPFRKIPVGGKRWDDEYGYHVSVYAEVFHGWLLRRNGQSTLHMIHPKDTDATNA